MKHDYFAAVLADSIAEGTRLTTFEVTFPRIVLAEFNTHRMLSRNSASSRAIPVEKRIAAVRANPFVPEQFGKNQKGMQASEILDPTEHDKARNIWLAACEDAVTTAGMLSELGVHKQLANRLIEPFCWHTVIVTATEWENFFALRCHPDAQPEIREAAELMRKVMDASTPIPKSPGEWHLPLVFAHEDPIAGADQPWVSAGRCARVSYLTHDGRRDVEADIVLGQRLAASGHMSPLEHPAFVETEHDPGDPGRRYGFNTRDFVGNFRWPWVQLRKTIPGEGVFRPKESV